MGKTLERIFRSQNAKNTDAIEDPETTLEEAMAILIKENDEYKRIIEYARAVVRADAQAKAKAELAYSDEVAAHRPIRKENERKTSFLDRLTKHARILRAFEKKLFGRSINFPEKDQDDDQDQGR